MSVKIIKLYNGVSVESLVDANPGGITRVFPVWSGSGPAEDCESWPSLEGFAFTATNGEDYETNTAELEVSWIPNQGETEMLTAFTTNRIILIHKQVVGHFTQIYTPSTPFPGIPAMFPRLFMRVGPSSTAWKFWAWWRYGAGVREVKPDNGCGCRKAEDA